MKKFVFDVDGTLTDSRKPINEHFGSFFADFCSTNEVYLVTGSDRPKTLEQLGEEILKRVKLTFNCAGAEVWKGDKLIRQTKWQPDPELITYLEGLLDKSKYSTRAGNHIELRSGMINFSVAGRNSTHEQRQQYMEWDKSTSERLHLVQKVTNRFNDVDAYIGGEIGIDIFPKGYGKARAIDEIRTAVTDVLYYFGDQVFENGNDYGAAIKCDHRYNVRHWGETYEILSYFTEARICA